ncbi:MAG: hypothetical protein SVY15_01595 [Halobacteriota archaeon]|nr:hypothetical protein [Halobacteriota archaeon]
MNKGIIQGFKSNLNKKVTSDGNAIFGLIIKLWPFITILFFASPSLFWLPKNHVFSYGLNFPMPPVEGIIRLRNHYLYSWDYIAGLGNPNFDTTTTLYYALLEVFTYFTGNISSAQSMYIYANYAGIAIAMYILCRTLDLDRSSSLFASLFYLLTPWVATGMPLAPIGLRVLPFYFFLPLTTAILIRTDFLITTRSWCYFGIVSLLATISNSSPQYFIIQSAIHLCILLIMTIGSKNKSVKFRFFLIKLFRYISITLLCNIYWIIPIFSGIGTFFKYRTEPGFSDASLLEGTGFSFLNGFRFLPYPPVEYVYQWGSFYYEPLLTSIAFLFIALSLSGILSKKKFISLPFAITLITALLLGKGTKPPLTTLSNIFFFHAPVITRLFRNLTYFEIPVIFASAVLMAIGIQEVRSAIRFRSKGNMIVLGMTSLLFIPLIIYGIPFFSGSFVEDSLPSKIDISVNVPNYYNETASFLRKDESLFRILSIPIFSKQDSYVFYNWNNKYYGQPMLHIWSGKPVIRAMYPIGATQPNPTIQSVMSPKSYFTDKDSLNLQLWNVKYISLHNDFDWDIFYMLNPHERCSEPRDLENFILYTNTFNKVAEFGEISLFKVSDDFFLPLIYSTTDAIFIDSKASTFIPIPPVVDINMKQAIFFSDLNDEKDFILEKANTYVSYANESGGIEPTKTSYTYTDYQDFENNTFGDWITLTSSDDSISLTNSAKYCGNSSAEIKLSGPGSQSHIYKDFGYDGESPINIDLWMKVVERKEPAGAFVYVRGYDSNGTEKVRVIYYSYDNWDYGTSAPGENNQTFYALKIHLDDPPYNTWINVNKNPRDDFGEAFPHTWDGLDLTKIRVDLYCWGDGAITAGYDTVNVKGVYNDPKTFFSSNFEFYIPKEGKYQVYKISDKVNEGQITNNLRLLEGSNISPIETNGSDYQSFEDGLGDWYVDISSGDATFLTGKDWNSGDFSAEIKLSGPGSQSHIYKDFGYDGESPINIDLWMKVVERKEPAGAFVYVRGYDSNGTEKVRVIYYSYDNWDYETSVPETNNQTYYVVKTNLSDPLYNQWININRNPRSDFDKKFPHVWDESNLTRIRVDLYCWGDGVITARYDDVKVSGVVSDSDILLVGSPKINDLNISIHSNDAYNIFTHIKTTPKEHTIPINLTVEVPRLINKMESSNPSFHPYGCTYTPSTSDDTLKITTFFDGPSEEREYVEVKELIHERSVNEYPDVFISCKVDDPDVQIIKMGFIVKNESGTVTTIWKTLEPYEDWHRYEINLYDRILRTYPDEAYTLSEITIVTSKMWGLDCSKDKRGAYTYYIKDLGVSKSTTTTEFPIVGFSVGAETFMMELNNTSFEWIKLREMYLEEGEHTVTWNVAGGGGVEVDNIRAVPKGQVFDPEDYNDEPSIVFQKINPTKYKVHVSTNEPFFLVFSESYHPQWKAYLDKRSFEFNDVIASYDNVDVKEAKHEEKSTPGDVFYLLTDPISDDKHFIVNGYANSWYIEETGEYDLTLYFLPQSLFYLGLFISGGTLFGCIGYLVRGWRRKNE